MQFSVGINKWAAISTAMYFNLNALVLRAKILYDVFTGLAHYHLPLGLPLACKPYLVYHQNIISKSCYTKSSILALFPRCNYYFSL